jgi:hypothetical protein
LSSERRLIASLRRTFSTESFERHLRQVADDVEAREQRRAEREHLLIEIPKLAAAEARLAKAIARTDEADALVAELKATQQERRAAEATVAYLEGVEMDVKADQDRVEQLREQWGTWSQFLDDDPLLAPSGLAEGLGLADQGDAARGRRGPGVAPHRRQPIRRRLGRRTDKGRGDADRRRPGPDPSPTRRALRAPARSPDQRRLRRTDHPGAYRL